MGPLSPAQQRIPELAIRMLPGLSDYVSTWGAMRAFTDARDALSQDELWLCQHPPVFTLGQAGRIEHLHAAGEIPVVHCDRGGQVTYHGPGQLVAYLLIDLRRSGLGVRRLVELLELSVIDLLHPLGISAQSRAGAPGVYVEGAKIASLGLRVRNGCTYHGLALNVAMDLSPFARIDPCGHVGLRVVQVCDLRAGVGLKTLARPLAQAIAERLGRRPRWSDRSSLTGDCAQDRQARDLGL